MKLNKKTIKELKKIYKERFNQEIDDTTAREYARKLFFLFKVVYGVPVEKEHDKYEQR